MESTHLVCCSVLKRYLPFLSFLIFRKFGSPEKFKTIRNWIQAQTIIPKNCVDKIEKCMNLAYKTLSQKKDFPNSLHNIFTVDLCSDVDSDDVEFMSKSKFDNCVLTVDSETCDEDDVEIISITNVGKSEEPKSLVQTQISSPNQKILEKINSIDFTHKSRTIMDSPPISTPPPPIWLPNFVDNLPSESNEEVLFQRRSKIQVQEHTKKVPEKEKYKKTKKSKRKDKKKYLKLMKKILSNLDIINVLDVYEDLDLTQMKTKLIQNITNKSTQSLDVQSLKDKSVSELLGIQRSLMLQARIAPSADIIDLLNKTINHKSTENFTGNSASTMVATENRCIHQSANSVLEPYTNTYNVSNPTETQNYSNMAAPYVPRTSQFENGYSTSCQPFHELHSYQNAQNLCVPNARRFDFPATDAVPAAHLLLSIQLDESHKRFQPATTTQETNYLSSNASNSTHFSALQSKSMHMTGLETDSVCRQQQPPYFVSQTVANENHGLFQTNVNHPAVMQLKDPRVRKLLSQGQYGHIKTLTFLETTKWAASGKKAVKSTKSPLNYGEYRHLKVIEAKKKEEKAKLAGKEFERQRESKQTNIKKKLTAVHPKPSKNYKSCPIVNHSESYAKSLKVYKNTPEQHSINERSQPPVSAPKKIALDQTKAAMNRELKKLECTFKGFNNLHAVGGKRRSSMSARLAIVQRQDDYIDSPMPKRRHSVHEKLLIEKPKSSPVMSNQNYVHKRCKAISDDILKDDFLEDPLILTRLKKRNETTKNTSEPSSTGTKKKIATLKIKNTSIRMTQRNTKECVLCKRRSRDLTHHYIHAHKTESFVSRLTWEELEDWLQKMHFAEKVSTAKNNDISVYKAVCPFCPWEKELLTDTFANLRRHFSNHTGEYSYKCKCCGLQKAFNSEIKKHQLSTRCKGYGSKCLYKYHANESVIHMYVCQICNFVQLNEENVFKHLREQHDKCKRVPQLVKEYTLLAIKDDGPIERVPLNRLPIVWQREEDCITKQWNENIPQETENVRVTNEPLQEENFYDAIESENAQMKENLNESKFLWDECSQEYAPFILAATSDVKENAHLDLKPDIFENAPDNFMLP